MTRSKLPIYKLSATGNDFLLVDLRRDARVFKSEWGKRSRAHWAKTWCHRQEGLGADGMIFLEPDKEADFKWDFYNSDGSRAEMCGNAARAVSLFASKGRAGKLCFRSRVGIVDAQVRSANQIEVTLPAILESRWNQSVNFNGAQLAYDFVRAGVPHVVVRVPHLEDRARLRELALAIKPSFDPEGTNVTFAHTREQKRIDAVTYERGVEDFTLSCGTGAVAAAYAVLRGEERSTIEVRVPGGRLAVVWKDGRPILKGPARIVAETHLLRSP